MLIKSLSKQNYNLAFASSQSLGFTRSYWGWLKIIGRWMERAQQRRDLAELDDHLLDDNAITRSAAAAEIAKPFWR